MKTTSSLHCRTRFFRSSAFISGQQTKEEQAREMKSNALLFIFWLGLLSSLDTKYKTIGRGPESPGGRTMQLNFGIDFSFSSPSVLLQKKKCLALDENSAEHSIKDSFLKMLGI